MTDELDDRYQPFAQILLGSNSVSGYKHVISTPYGPMVQIEQGDDGQALATIDVYASSGSHVAKLRRNAWVFNNDGTECSLTRSVWC